jgi:anti-anti-sigma factor
MVIDSKIINGSAVVRISGTLSVENLGQFDKTLGEYLDTGVNAILDFSKLNFIDSSCLGIIVMYYSRYGEAGKILCISSLNSNIFQMFSLTGIGRRVPIYDSVEDALEYLSEQSE